jgi:hypothetical protein
VSGSYRGPSVRRVLGLDTPLGAPAGTPSLIPAGGSLRGVTRRHLSGTSRLLVGLDAEWRRLTRTSRAPPGAEAVVDRPPRPAGPWRIWTRCSCVDAPTRLRPPSSAPWPCSPLATIWRRWSIRPGVHLRPLSEIANSSGTSGRSTTGSARAATRAMLVHKLTPVIRANDGAQTDPARAGGARRARGEHGWTAGVTDRDRHPRGSRARRSADGYDRWLRRLLSPFRMSGPPDEPSALVLGYETLGPAELERGVRLRADALR